MGNTTIVYGVERQIQGTDIWTTLSGSTYKFQEQAEVEMQKYTGNDKLRLVRFTTTNTEEVVEAVRG